MQILEVKNNIAKIGYNPSENNLLPSDFLLIEDNNQKLIAQVINIETTDKSENNLAVLRLALNIDKEDNLSYYNGYIPAKNSKLIYITSEEIIELIKGCDDNIYFGNLSNHSDCFVKTGISFIDDGLYIQSDRSDKTQIIFKNLISELKDKNKKILIIDFDGQYSSIENVFRLKISENVKLPLNIEAFDTILEHDIKDCPIEDIAVIQSIVLELREYLKTLKDKFIPFNIFKTVVDEEFTSNPISGLMLLRNKLWLYAQDGIFADFKEQFDVINSAFSNKNIIILDASGVADKWYKFIIQYVYEFTNLNCYVLLSLNDIDIDKKTVSNLYNKSNVIPVAATNYESKYRAILKSLCKNQILCKPSKILQEQEYYTPLLSRMNNDDILLFGETTLYLPLQLELKQFDEYTNDNVTQNEIKRDVDKLLSSPKTLVPAAAAIIKPIEQETKELPEENFIDNAGNIEPEAEEQKETEKAEDDVLDSDFDFLDAISADKYEELNDDDILNVPFSLTPREDIPAIVDAVAYDVFEPVKEEENIQNETQITSDSDIEPINIGEEPMKDEEVTQQSEELPVQREELVPINETSELKEESQEELREINADDELTQRILAEPNSDDVLLDESMEEFEQDNAQDITGESEEISVQDNALETEEELEAEEVPEAQVSDLEETADDEMVSLDEVIDDLQNKAKESIDSASEENQEETKDTEQEPEQKQEEEFVVELEDDDDISAKTQEKVRQPIINEEVLPAKTKRIPIYETDIPKSPAENEMPFKIGDKVYHPKHGTGIIEGFANYSNKILFCQIDFDNVGRRILDPRISGLEKIVE